jgi:hypothetical protein
LTSSFKIIIIDESMEENTIIKNSIVMFRNRAVRLFVLVVFLILAGVAFYFYNQYQSTKSLLQNPTASSNAEAKQTLEQVGKLIELPKNEQPKLATVTDVNQLSGQPFFMNAKNGDRVLIYAVAGKAILYRPSINKIIEVAPVNTNPASQPQAQIQPGPTVLVSPTVTPIVTLAPTKALIPTATLTPTPTQ